MRAKLPSTETNGLKSTNLILNVIFGERKEERVGNLEVYIQLKKLEYFFSQNT